MLGKMGVDGLQSLQRPFACSQKGPADSGPLYLAPGAAWEAPWPVLGIILCLSETKMETQLDLICSFNESIIVNTLKPATQTERKCCYLRMLKKILSSNRVYGSAMM